VLWLVGSHSTRLDTVTLLSFTGCYKAHSRLEQHLLQPARSLRADYLSSGIASISGVNPPRFSSAWVRAARLYL